MWKYGDGWCWRVIPLLFLLFSGILSHFTVFVLACVGGLRGLNVSHALIQLLMAVTNAISGIIIVGALLQIRQPTGTHLSMRYFVAILVASINILVVSVS